MTADVIDMEQHDAGGQVQGAFLTNQYTQESRGEEVMKNRISSDLEMHSLWPNCVREGDMDREREADRERER